LSRAELASLMQEIEAPFDLMAGLLYGCGLRLNECLELRIHCLDLDARLLTVHDGKGLRDRTVPLPERLLPALRVQMSAVQRLLESDLALGAAGTFLPAQSVRPARHRSTRTLPGETSVLSATGGCQIAAEFLAAEMPQPGGPGGPAHTLTRRAAAFDTRPWTNPPPWG
jgi:integrase